MIETCPMIILVIIFLLLYRAKRNEEMVLYCVLPNSEKPSNHFMEASLEKLALDGIIFLLNIIQSPNKHVIVKTIKQFYLSISIALVSSIQKRHDLAWA
jgi:hypothetical protein